MIQNNYVTAIIPARGGSKRLPHKNIYPLWGKPLLFWVIKACQESRYIDEIVVSSEDQEILNIAKECGAFTVRRPDNLAGDNVFKQDVICHATRWLMKSKKHSSPDIVISLQPNSPEVKSQDLDAALEKLLLFKRQELFSVDSNLNQNAAFRIMLQAAVFQKSLSTNCGVYQADYTDVHTKEDIAQLEKQHSPRT